MVFIKRTSKDNNIADNELERALLLLISMNVMGFAAYYYLVFTPYKYIGSFKGWPIYVQYIPIWMLFLYLLLIAISILIIFLSANINENKVKVSQLITWFGLLISIILTGALYMSSFKLTYSLIGGYSDSYIIQIGAAKTLLELQNPYKSSYLQYLILKESYPYYSYIFKYPFSYTSNKIIGFVSSYDYLAFAMIYYIPKVLLNIPKSIYDAIIYVISLFLVYRKMKGPYKMLFPLILASSSFIFVGEPVFFSPIVGWIAITMVAIAYYNYPLISGLLFGLAGSYRETAIVFFLFYLVALHFEKHNAKKAFEGFLISSLLVNLPFFILSPYEFIKEALAPIAYNLMPIGAGLSTITEYGIYLPKIFYTSLFLSVIVIGLITYIKYYQKLKYAGLAIPAIAFLFYYRPLPFYYIWSPFFIIIAASTLFYKGNETNHKYNIDTNWLIISYELVVASLILFLLTYIVKISDIVLIIGLLGLLLISANIFINGIHKFEIYYKPKYATYIILLSIVLASILAIKYAPSVSIFISSKAYQNSQELAVEMASIELIKGHNPYNANFYLPIIRNTSFGYLSETIPYNESIIKLTKINVDKTFYMYYNIGDKTWHNITVYDFLPGLAILYSPAILLSLSPNAYSSILYAISFGILGILFYKNGKLNQLLITILMGFYIPLIYFTSNIIASLILSSLILSIVLLRYNPIISGILFAISILTYPHILILSPFYVIFVLYYNRQIFKKFLIAMLSTISLIFIAFLLTSNSFLNYSFMQILYYTKGNINLGLILNIDPIILLFIGIILTITLSIYYYKNFYKIKEFGFLIPLFIAAVLPSFSIDLIAIFIMIVLIMHFYR
ncbi:hypothetical protein Calag_0253 [Caldisphaera lagunensis DSM 15908]|uniref:Uncharacterized protein n=1 Tax=Caldisphaera lagunensis (strain DSM 15908 / JCM 11604 / ANMR 0165 / IC-154) TaxID=1056495 RepID=L0AAG7_CALLD|nr:hypothetical protein [Caldisphaera lagunensis]AFZ70035.1 hypothetical protein Calag_0253 [Caldisphaera lagunensis DSM 15908]